jgi:hypothetical protein
VELERSLAGVQVDQQSLRFTRYLTITEWGGVFATLLGLRQSIHWWLGDALLQGEAWHGEPCYQYVPDLGYVFETLQNDRRVAARWPREKRIPGLSFSTHMFLAPLPEPERFAWGERAAKEGLTRKQLKEAIDAEKVSSNGTGSLSEEQLSEISAPVDDRRLTMIPRELTETPVMDRLDPGEKWVSKIPTLSCDLIRSNDPDDAQFWWLWAIKQAMEGEYPGKYKAPSQPTLVKEFRIRVCMTDDEGWIEVDNAASN